MSTLFTRIAKGEIPAEIVYEDSHVFAFRDVAPQAPFHVLIVPREETAGLASLPDEGDHLYILNAARRIAEKFSLDSGYRLVINQGKDAGQTVQHLHAHLMAGRPFAWPPG
ncbi:MAG: HIT domain-containing protein [Fimbriimonadaceae bacterium]|nr:HIT domain-containing protein [Fimbriimonadaceae bacterium]